VTATRFVLATNSDIEVTDISDASRMGDDIADVQMHTRSACQPAMR
jgi:hypothetical protein